MAAFEDFGLLVGRYHATAPTLSDGQPAELLMDSSSRQIISGRWLEDSAHASGDAGLFMLAVRNDAGGALVDTDGDYAPFQVDAQGRLRVNAEITVDVGAEKAEDSAHVSGDTGNYILAVRSDARPTNANTDADGDYASFFVNASGELYVTDVDALAKLTEIDNAIDAMALNVASIAGSIYAEDSAHTSGDDGQFILAVRNDADAVLTDADLDYSAIAVDSAGRVKITGDISVSAPGTEEYAAADALAADADGLISVSGTFTDVASVAVGAGQTAYIYGWQFDADKNAVGKLMVDDGTNEFTYKVRLNSSSMPGVAEHWSEGGRIEIAGSATTNVKVQVRRRDAGAGTSQASGSIHVRIV